MVFSNIQAYLDPSNWQQQLNSQIGISGTTGGNPQFPSAPQSQAPPPPPPHGMDGLGSPGSIRPGSMSDRARMANIPMPETALKCPRCESTNTKFCYFNNYSLSQPRHFCKTCRRYWTRGGALRSVPVGYIGVKNVEAFNLPYYLQQSIGESSRDETDDPMIGVETPFQDISMDDVPVASASTVQSEINVTIKVNYGGDFVRFQLSASSGIHELYRQVSQRLELVERTYDLSYRDEDNDLILLTCDEDLQFYISSSTEQENYTLLVWIEPKCASPM